MTPIYIYIYIDIDIYPSIPCKGTRDIGTSKGTHIPHIPYQYVEPELHWRSYQQLPVEATEDPHESHKLAVKGLGPQRI